MKWKPISDWRDSPRFWSVQVAIFWGVFSGFYLALPVFQLWLTPERYIVLCIVMSVIFVLARVTKQPGMN